MTPERFEREKSYGAVLAIAGQLQKYGLITAIEYHRLVQALIQKYHPLINSLRMDADEKEGQK